MKIFAHRGLWRSKKEQNSLVAFRRALDAGFGIECDLRDACGKIVVAHDLPGKSVVTFSHILEELSKHRKFKKVNYAINIKSDGIEKETAHLVNEFGIANNSFVFDMSVPSLYIFSKTGIDFASRLSDIEACGILYQDAAWAWLDELEEAWIKNSDILKHLKRGKSVCIVSPELHGRGHLEKWKQYRRLSGGGLPGELYLCTDFPLVADRFFNGSK